MTPATLYDFFRADMMDAVTPYLWSDDEVWSFMDEAQKHLVRLTGGISDATSTLCSIDVAVGDEWIDIDPRVLKIRHVQKSTNDAELQIVNFEDTELLQRDNDYGIRRILKLNSDTGPLQYLVAGMERSKLRLLPIPDTAETLSFIIYRLPLETISADNQPDFEVEEQHHRPLMWWMKKLAYEKQDAETFDKNKSVEFEQKFLNYCQTAKHERELREHKYRAVVYGGL